MVIEQHGGLSQEDIDKMIKDAEEHAKEDKELKDVVAKKYEAESYINEIEKQIKEYETKLSSDLLSNLRKEIEELKTAVNSNNKIDIEEKFNALKQTSMKMYSEINEAEANKDNEKKESEKTADTDKKESETKK